VFAGGLLIERVNATAISMLEKGKQKGRKQLETAEFCERKKGLLFFILLWEINSQEEEEKAPLRFGLIGSQNMWRFKGGH